jgi:hypothetical protein
MAYYIFLKSLRSLEEFRKNPHVKIPPKSPSTNFQSLGKFKIPIFNSEIPFSLTSARPTLRPTRPLAQPARWPRCPRRPKLPPPAHLARASVTSSREYVFPFGSRLPSGPPLPHLFVNRAPAISSIPHLQPPELAHVVTTPRPPSTAQLHASGATGPLPPRLHFSSLNSPLKPSSVFNGVKAINAGINPPLPGAPLTPIKGEHHLRSSPHLSQPLFASLCARAFLSPSAAASGSTSPLPGLHDVARAPVRP